MKRKLTLETLMDYAADRLNEADTAAVAALLVHDPAAAANVVRLRRVVQLARADASIDAPAHVIARASRLLRQRLTTHQTAEPGLLRRIFAALSFDSDVAPALGMRALQTAGSPRQLLFNAEGVDLDIRITRASSGYIISGQVLGREEPGVVTLLRADQAVASVTLNALSEFALPAMIDGSYVLTLRQGDTEIVVSGLELGASKG